MPGKFLPALAGALVGAMLLACGFAVGYWWRGDTAPADTTPFRQPDSARCIDAINQRQRVASEARQNQWPKRDEISAREAAQAEVDRYCTGS